MNYIITIAVVLQVLSAIAIIILVLLQHGKGADLGAAFGGGASGSLFGATGSANFLSRSTAIASTIFFCSTLAITIGAKYNRAPASTGVLGTIEQTTEAPAPIEAPAAASPEAPAEKDAPAEPNPSQIPK